MRIQCLMIFAFLLSSLGACRHHPKPISPLIDIVNKKFAAMNRHDIDALSRLYASDAVIQSPNMEKTETGPQGARTVYARYFTTSPDMVYLISRILPGDSSVTVEYTFGGTMKHLEKDVPQYMLDKYYKLKSCSVLEIHNGKITADVSYFDQLAFLQQVGFFDKHAF